MFFTDRAQIADGRARITPEGYFVADALVARANNIQDYRASELGDAFADRDPNSTVRVFRPESEVFAVDSLRTASRLPITLNHPQGQMVDANNWREFAKGETGETVLRDREFLRVPIRVTDAGAVQAVGKTHPEFSLGYSADLRVGSGTFNDQAYDASLANIRYNHLAACPAARGGPELRITDERPAGIAPQPKGTPMLVMVDSLPIDVSNPETAKLAIERLVTARDSANDATAAAQATITARDGTIAERDAEIVTLKDAVEKAKLTPAALRDAAGSYARTIAAAKALGATFGDADDELAVKRAAVSHKMGDAAKTYTDEQVGSAFDVLAATVKDAVPGTVPDPLRAALQDGAPVNAGDLQAQFADVRAKRLARMATGYRGDTDAAASA
jgi:hypothetical protein